MVSLGRGKSSLEYPELSSAVKAVAVKDFAVYLAKVVAELPQIDDYTRIRAACSWAMAEFIHVTDNAGLILTNEQVDCRADLCEILFSSSNHGGR